MSVPDKEIKTDETRPDRLALAMLIIGFILVCSLVLYQIVFFIVGGWRLAQPILQLFILGGIGIIYGLFRTVRGNPATKQLVKTTLKKMRSGALAGSATALVALQTAQWAANHASWYNWLNGLIPTLILDIPAALFFGVSAGSIGGFILGKIWKNKKAVVVGGILGGGIACGLYMLIAIRGLHNG
jgi:hypothetical protein